jgi:F-type H+-transporting ATPase subunit b
MDLNNFAAQSSGIGALGVNLQALIIQLVTFILVYIVLRKYAFKPILKVLKERRDLIESGVNLGITMQKQQEELDKKAAKLLHDAQAEADRVISQSKDEAKEIINESENNAKKKAEAILDDANRLIDQNTINARKKLERQLVGLVSEATEAIIDEKLDKIKLFKHKGQ